MEHRVEITIPEFPPVDDEDAWEPFIHALEEHGCDMGPILSWDEERVARVFLPAAETAPVP